MKLDTFLHCLHFDIEKLHPPGWEVDWEDAPLTYKLYQNVPSYPLSLEVPLSLENRKKNVTLNAELMGHFLWYVYGLTQISQAMTIPTDKDLLLQSFRRFPPSGGALYPNELYVYLKVEDLPVGVYHYDVAHHQLVLLREGNYDSYIEKALGNRYNLADSFATIMVSTVFWKNFFKYHYFSYRLQGLDTGVLIGQLLEVAKCFHFKPTVCFQFLDESVHHLLGMNQQEESVYALIPLSTKTLFSNKSSHPLTANELSKQLPPIQHQHYMRSKKVKEYPMIVQMNQASQFHSTTSFVQRNGKERVERGGPKVALPLLAEKTSDLATVCKKRFSPEMDFTWGQVNSLQLSSLLKQSTASFSYQNDLDEQMLQNRVWIYLTLHHLDDVVDGAYFYDSTSHTLRRISEGDFRVQMQYGMTMDNVNLQQVPICLHVAGDRHFLTSIYGYRGYRILQMEAGMLVQRILLTATAMGLGGHPLLGFDVKNCDQLYRMEEVGHSTFIQIPIGQVQSRPWLKASLRC